MLAQWNPDSNQLFSNIFLNLPLILLLPGLTSAKKEQQSTIKGDTRNYKYCCKKRQRVVGAESTWSGERAARGA